MRTYLPFKTAGISAFIGVFFIGYFHVLHHPVRPVTIMPLTALDRLIPLQPWAMIPYLSLWVYVGVAPGLLLTFRELIGYGLWAAGLCVAGLVAFLAWPTAVPPHCSEHADHPWLAILQGVDATGNACPSLHVATAMFTAIWVGYLFRRINVPRGLRLLNAAWFVAIAYSTLATKQHVAIDMLSGAVLGGGFALAALRWYSARGPKPFALS